MARLGFIAAAQQEVTCRLIKNELVRSVWCVVDLITMKLRLFRSRIERWLWYRNNARLFLMIQLFHGPDFVVDHACLTLTWNMTLLLTEKISPIEAWDDELVLGGEVSLLAERERNFIFFFFHLCIKSIKSENCSVSWWTCMTFRLLIPNATAAAGKKTINMAKVKWSDDNEENLLTAPLLLVSIQSRQAHFAKPIIFLCE